MPNSSESILQRLRRTLLAEAESVAQLGGCLDETWVEAVQLLALCSGKVAVVALGKSGHVGRKLAATMASLGTPSFFIHAAEAAHGDLGMLSTGDVVIAISYSGETNEVVNILPAVRRIGCRIIAMTGRRDSSLARAVDLSLVLPISREADHLGLAPTASSTLTLAAGDALAVAVSELKGFDRAQFGLRHPGGALGRLAKQEVGDVG